MGGRLRVGGVGSPQASSLTESAAKPIREDRLPQSRQALVVTSERSDPPRQRPVASFVYVLGRLSYLDTQSSDEVLQPGYFNRIAAVRNIPTSRTLRKYLSSLIRWLYGFEALTLGGHMALWP